MLLPSYNDAIKETEVRASGSRFDWTLCPSPLRRCYSAFKNAAKTAYWMAFRAMLNVIPLTMILIGLLNYDGCPAEPYIPQWLILMGILLIIKYFIDLTDQVRNLCIGRPNIIRPIYKAELSPIDWIFAGLALMLYLFGSYWVLKSYGIVQYTLEGDNDFCDHFTYMTTFVITTVVTVILLGLIICSCLCFGVLYWEDKHQLVSSGNSTAPKEKERQQLTAPKPEKEDSISSAPSVQKDVFSSIHSMEDVVIVIENAS